MSGQKKIRLDASFESGNLAERIRNQRRLKTSGGLRAEQGDQASLGMPGDGSARENSYCRNQRPSPS
jgi:hypothetical protein